MKKSEIALVKSIKDKLKWNPASIMPRAKELIVTIDVNGRYDCDHAINMVLYWKTYIDKWVYRSDVVELLSRNGVI